jgi:Xaa-Pro aminopeptidase
MATNNGAGREQSESERLRFELVREKRAQAVALLQQHGIDCWLTFAREGSDLMLPYVLGSDEIVGVSALMIFADGGNVAIVADYDVGQVADLYDDVISYSLDWREPLQQILAERRPNEIALNFSATDHGIDGLTHGLYLALTEALLPVGFDERLRSSEPVATAIRSIKMPSELERMRRAATITQRIFDDLTGMLRPGLTERDVYEIIHERMTTYEVTPAWEASWCPTVATSRTESGHNPPGMTKIEPGDAVRVDFGVKYDEYCSDMQRTWYLRRPGESGPPADLIHAYETVRDGIRLAADLIKPGVRGYEVDGPVRKLVADRGYTFTHALGHQLGRLTHDGGMLLAQQNARYGDRSGGVIGVGMVFTLEPCIDAIGLEDDIVVTERGCEFLIPTPDAMTVV